MGFSNGPSVNAFAQWHSHSWLRGDNVCEPEPSAVAKREAAVLQSFSRDLLRTQSSSLAPAWRVNLSQLGDFTALCQNRSHPE